MSKWIHAKLDGLQSIDAKSYDFLPFPEEPELFWGSEEPLSGCFAAREKVKQSKTRRKQYVFYAF